MSETQQPSRSGTPEAERMEKWVIDACQAVGLPITSASDDFFQADGTSLTVIRLIARAEAEFGDDCLPPEDIYERSTVRGIAASIIRNSASATKAGSKGS
ncbi:phosphopantetheine-binding protein [Streptomyces sp. RKAG290]|uniref:phosphopantetheine-binding protein n=1 Tax=Streptomyces sp. RKAG290 TaxID=2888348 RepID=UPI0020338D5A|nr:phosphopantetheine-binding protein [Streptomyces sp. RKAG290]MCM2416302.1 acyl carrier protein [Streptomyces sp. RKAG290]